MEIKKILAPSLLSANFACLEKDLAAVESAGAEFLHLDIMDGHFVPNITFGPPVVKKLRPVSGMVFDVHLMVSRPQDFLKAFAMAGADILNVHAETCENLPAILAVIRELGVHPAVTIKPGTSLFHIREVLPLVDLVMVMTVEPGFGGQKLIPRCLDKVRALREMREHMGLRFLIETDGGVTLENAATILDAGADVLVAGTAVFGASDPGAAAREFLKLM